MQIITSVTTPEGMVIVHLEEIPVLLSIKKETTYHVDVYYSGDLPEGSDYSTSRMSGFTFDYFPLENIEEAIPAIISNYKAEVKTLNRKLDAFEEDSDEWIEMNEDIAEKCKLCVVMGTGEETRQAVKTISKAVDDVGWILDIWKYLDGEVESYVKDSLQSKSVTKDEPVSYAYSICKVVQGFRV